MAEADTSTEESNSKIQAIIDRLKKMFGELASEDSPGMQAIKEKAKQIKYTGAGTVNVNERGQQKGVDGEETPSQEEPSSQEEPDSPKYGTPDGSSNGTIQQFIEAWRKRFRDMKGASGNVQLNRD